MNSVHAQLGAVLKSVLGQALLRVDYMCFPHEASDALTANELDGEITLTFEGSTTVRLTWCQAPGWNEVNSLIASTESHFSKHVLLQYCSDSAHSRVNPRCTWPMRRSGLRWQES